MITALNFAGRFALCLGIILIVWAAITAGVKVAPLTTLAVVVVGVAAACVVLWRDRCRMNAEWDSYLKNGR